MSYALFKTNQSTKILVELTEPTKQTKQTETSNQPEKLFQHNKENIPFAGLLPKEITLVDTNIGDLKNCVDIYKPDIVIKNNNAISFKICCDDKSKCVYLEVNCNVNQLDKYYSLFQLIQNYKSIKSQLNLN